MTSHNFKVEMYKLLFNSMNTSPKYVKLYNLINTNKIIWYSSLIRDHLKKKTGNKSGQNMSEKV